MIRIKLRFGFRNSHSTFMALVILIEILEDDLDHGKCAMGMFLDFHKAFDTVDHGISLDEYFCNGIRLIAHGWFVSYPSSRQKLVIYSGHGSELKLMRCCVAQGSIVVFLFILKTQRICLIFKRILFANGPIFFAFELTWNIWFDKSNKKWLMYKPG